MPWQKLREQINLFIYDSKSGVLKWFGRANAGITIMMIGALVYYYGFPVGDMEKSLILRIIQFFFGFYILYYLLKIFYDFSPAKFIRNTRWEALMAAFLVAEGISFALSGKLLASILLDFAGLGHWENINEVLIPIYFFVLLLIELFSGERKFAPVAKLHPALIFIISIFGLIFIGTLLLLLPEMTVSGISFVDALFMASTSVSVTGLVTLDVSADFTQKGQIVLMILFQLGGLNAIAFGALFFLFMKMGVGSKHHEIIEDFVNKDSLLQGSGMFRKILLWTIRIELVGILLLFFFLPKEGMFHDPGDRLYSAIYNGISAFNNAGITNIPGAMSNELLSKSYAVHMVVMVLFFLGSFGMIYLFDLFEFRKLRERMRFRWKTIEFGTKLSLYFSLALLGLGVVVMLLFESSRTMEGMTWSERIFHSFYFSMTTRNAGFSLYDTGSLSLPVLIVFMFLMFVGAGSGSAAGGIRVSTFGVLWASVISTIKNRQHVEIFKRTLSTSLVFKAAAITIFFAVGNLAGIFALAITEASAIDSGMFRLQDIIFEHVSAASTVGLSTGITPYLSEAGKVVLVVAMFIGRVGTLTLAYLLSQRGINKGYKYPEAHTMVG